MKRAKRRRLKINKPWQESKPAETGEFIAEWLNSNGWGYLVEEQQRLKALLLELNGVRAAKRLEIGEAELGPVNELLKEYPWVLELQSPKTRPGKAPSPRLYFVTEPAGRMEQGHTWLKMLIRLMSLGLLDRMRPCANCGCWFYARLPKAEYHSTLCRQAHFRSTHSKEEKAEYQKNYYKLWLSPNKQYYKKGWTVEAVRNLKKQKGTRRKHAKR